MKEKLNIFKIRRKAKPCNCKVGVMDYKFSVAQYFNYLGVTITRQNKIDQEIQERLMGVNISMLKLLQCKLRSRNIKI